MGRVRCRRRGPWLALLGHVCGLLGALLVLGLPLLLQRFWPGLAYGLLKLIAHARQPGSCHCPAASNSTRKDAIILLVQKKRLTRLRASLASLHKYFNSCFRKDVLLFHNGDFTLEDQIQMLKDFPLVAFHHLEVGGKYWRVPPALEKRGAWKSTKGYSEGYRHMCRFHYKMVFEYLENLGYKWFMRLDDDSFIMSCIDYDIFQFMEDNNHTYGWRLSQLEYQDFGENLPELVDAFLREHRLPTSWALNNHYEGGRLTTESWDRWTYYNNFMITKVSWWRSPIVSTWLERVDQSGIAYLYRVGDAPIQTFTQMMFMPGKQVHHFQDWSYTHGPVIALSLSSLLPSFLSSYLREDDQDYEWVAGLQDMNEYAKHGPVIQSINSLLRRLMQVPWL